LLIENGNGNKSILSKRTIKALVLTFNEKLEWTDHIEKMTQKTPSNNKEP